MSLGFVLLHKKKILYSTIYLVFLLFIVIATSEIHHLCYYIMCFPKSFSNLTSHKTYQLNGAVYHGQLLCSEMKWFITMVALDERQTTPRALVRAVQGKTLCVLLFGR